jgi:uncharacterized protein
LDEREYRVDHEAIKRRRKQRLMRRRIRAVLMLACIVVLAAFLFSPWGPWGGVFFAPDDAHESEEALEVESEVEGEAEIEEEASQEGGETAGRKDKASDPNPPAVAIVVDDVGLDAANLEHWLMVDAPITFAALPYCAATAELSDSLYAAGYRIMLHIPTELDPPNSFSGKGQLEVGMSRQTVFDTLDANLATVPNVCGINNHQGGRGCNDLQLMTYMCEWALERGLYVVDSNSSTHSQVTKAAMSLGLPRRLNQVFIDGQNDPEYIRSQMRKLADIARQNGTAIGICHFHRPYTPTIVGEMVRELRAEGINFAFVQDISN